MWSPGWTTPSCDASCCRQCSMHGLTCCKPEPCFPGYSGLNRELMLEPKAVVPGMSSSQWDWLMQELHPRWSLYPGWWLANHTKPLSHNLNLRPIGGTKPKGWAEMGRHPERSPKVLSTRQCEPQENRRNGVEKRDTESIWRYKQRKQKQSVAESPYWQSNREGATDAHCWSNVKKNRWLEVYCVLSDIPSSVRQLLKLLPALPHFLMYPYNAPHSPKSPEHVSFPGNLKEPCQQHVVFISLLWHVSGGIMMIRF